MSETAESPANGIDGAEPEPEQPAEQPASEDLDEDELEVTLGARRDAASEGEEDEDDAAADDGEAADDESGDGYVTGVLLGCA